MKRPDFLLTDREIEAMDIFWKEDRPLTSTDLMDRLVDWKDGYIYFVTNSLMKKGMIDASGFVKTNAKKYSRTFVPIVTKEEYAAKLALSLDPQENFVPKVALALAKEASGENNEKLIAELEGIIEELKKQI